MNNVIRGLAIVTVGALLIAELTGCEALRRKFTRKKKAREPRVYYELEKHVKEPNAVIYRRHYIYWKTWQEELINKISEDNYRKLLRCAQEIVWNLEGMKRCLTEEKAARLQLHIDEMEKIKNGLDYNLSTNGRRTRTKIMLEKRYRAIKREFSYTKVKDYIKPDIAPPTN